MSTSSAISKLYATVIAAVIAIAVIAAVAIYMTSAPPAVTTTPVATTPRVAEIKVGLIQPLTGPAALVGQQNVMGALFAVDEINAQGGVQSLGGAKIKLVIADSTGDPSVAAREAERLITVEKVVAVLGAYRSADTKTISEVCERYQTPCLNPDSVSTVLTKRGLQWFFRTSPHDDVTQVDLVELLKYINETYPGFIKTIALLYEDSEYGVMGASVFEPLAKEAGFVIVEKIPFRSGTPSLDAEVLRLKAANPDVLWIAAYLTDAILLQKTLAKYDFAPKIVYYYGVVENPQFAKETGPLGWYVLDKSGFNWDIFEQNPRLRELNQRFKERYGVDFNDASFRNYVSVWVLYYALEIAGKRASPENLEEFRKALRDALLEVDIGPGVFPPWEGVKFSTEGPDLHQNIRAKSTIMQLYPDGKWYTVWPLDVATKPIVFPFPKWSERPSS